MSKTCCSLIIAALLVVIYGCGSESSELPLSFKIMVENPSVFPRQDAPISLNLAEIKAKYPDFNARAFCIICDGAEIPFQLNPAGADTHLVFVVNLEASREKILNIRYAKTGTRTVKFPKRTQAEIAHKFGGRFVNRVYEGGQFKNVESMWVPPEHTDHSWFIRYEGPGWESDKVGYRFYLDWRNAIDIYGKKIPDMVLQDVGQDGFESYHSMNSWGMDVLKVGESLGIGSLGMWLDKKAERVAVTDSIFCEVRQNGVVQSQVRTHYFGWQINNAKYDLVSDLTIVAGSRMTRHDIKINPEPPNLCTGIVKLENVTLLSSTDQDRDWMYFATYGRQSLANDNLGMAVLFRRQDMIQISEDQNSYVIVLKPSGGMLSYYFLAAWELEPNGIKSEDQFVSYLKDTVKMLEQELKVIVK